MSGAVTRVLIIDDDEACRRFVRTVLAPREGFEVLEAASAAEGLEVVERETPDAVLLDVRMPRMSGTEVLRLLRRRRFEGPVVMLTGCTRRETIIDCFTHGADHYLTKPLSATELLSSLSKAFSAHAQQRDEAMRLERAFTANITHELRTPLQALMSFPLFALEDLEHGQVDRASELLRETRTAAERMAELIDHVLDLSVIEAGRAEFTMEQVDFGELIDGMVRSLRPLADDKGIELRQAARRPVEVAADRLRMEQVLRNLIGNAVKFTEAGGRVEVRAQRLGPRLRVSVADTGPGIPEAELQAVFEKFRQGSRTRGRVKGSGLGLVVCREIVVAHGGRIWAENVPAGHGALFHFELPLDHAARSHGFDAHPQQPQEAGAP